VIYILVGLGLISVLTMVYACLCAAGREDEEMDKRYEEHMK